MRPAADRLAELTGADVTLAPAVVGDEVEAFAANLSAGRRPGARERPLRAGRDQNDPELAAALARLADVYVNDAFGAAHRAHASTEGVARLIDERAAGLLLEQEVTTLSRAARGPRTAARRGARRAPRSSDKIAVIERFLARGRHDPDRRRDVLPVPRRPGPRGRRVAVRRRGRRAGAAGARREPTPRARRSSCRSTSWSPTGSPPMPRPQPIDGVDVPDGLMGLDIGPRTADAYREAIARRRHRVLERPDGGVRARAVRGRHPGGGRGGRRSAGDDRRRRRRFGRGARISSGSPTGSPTSRPAAARRSSCSRASGSPGWRRSHEPRPADRRQLEDVQDRRGGRGVHPGAAAARLVG